MGRVLTSLNPTQTRYSIDLPSPSKTWAVPGKICVKPGPPSTWNWWRWSTTCHAKFCMLMLEWDGMQSMLLGFKKWVWSIYVYLEQSDTPISHIMLQHVLALYGEFAQPILFFFILITLNLTGPLLHIIDVFNIWLLKYRTFLAPIIEWNIALLSRVSIK
jgi:hypothetical protein